jgi:hypothetical protein
VFSLAKKDDQSRYYGKLSVVDEKGKATAVVSAVVGQSMFLDLAPDGKKALLVAYAVDAPGTDLTETKEFSTRLFEVDVAKGAARKVDKDASYAIYSPDGTRVLLGTPPDGFSLNGVKLEVADAGLTTFTTVADEALPLAIGGEGRRSRLGE